MVADLTCPDIVSRCINKYDTQVLTIYTQKLSATMNTIKASYPSQLSYESSTMCSDALMRGEAGFAELAAFMRSMPMSIVTKRRRLEARELLGMSFLESGDLKLEEMRGRISGELTWRLARGEARAVAATGPGRGES